MVTVRFDDISSNTNFEDLAEQRRAWVFATGGCRFLYGITLFAKNSVGGSVYPNPPFRKMERVLFYDVNNFIEPEQVKKVSPIRSEWASHGLVHVDHALLNYDAQELSILTSCRFIGCEKFIPPFNSYNEITESICKKHGIHLIRNTDVIKWKSIEFHKYSPKHEHWYYHPWRIDAGSLGKKLGNLSSHTV